VYLVSASPGALTAEHPQTNTPTRSLNLTPTDRPELKLPHCRAKLPVPVRWPRAHMKATTQLHYSVSCN